MNAFKLSILFFLIIVTLTTINSIIINAMTDTLLGLIDSTEEFSAKWQEYRPYLSIMLTEEHLYTIEIALAEMHTYQQAKETAEYLSARARLQLTIQRIRRFEQIALENLI